MTCQCINTALLKLFKRGFFWENGLILLCNIFKVSHVPPAIKSWPTLRNGKEPKYSWSRRDQKKNCTHLWLMAMGISRSRFALKNRNFARPDHHLQYIYEYNHLPSFKQAASFTENPSYQTTHLDFSLSSGPYITSLVIFSKRNSCCCLKL